MSRFPGQPGEGTGSFLVPGGAQFEAGRPLVDLGPRPNLAQRQYEKKAAKQRPEIDGGLVYLGLPSGQKGDIPRGW